MAFFPILMLASCSVRNYPKNVPFVFGNKVIVKGEVSKDEKERLAIELNNYWDDSMKPNRFDLLGLFYRLQSPPRFDSANVWRSKSFMNQYLNTQGYYYARFSPATKEKNKGNQRRCIVTMSIELGKSIRLDSIGYALIDTGAKPVDSTLQKLALLQKQASLLVKGKPFTRQSVNSEIDRLVGWFHQNGYYKFSREYLYAQIDTVDERFLKLTLDPFQQAKLIAEADKKRKLNPTWSITLRQKNQLPKGALQKFHIGRRYYFIDLKNNLFAFDSTVNVSKYKREDLGDMTQYYQKRKLKFRPLDDHTYLRRGDLYNENLYYKSINRLLQIGAWKQIDIRTIVRNDSIDLYFYMVPEKKQGYAIDQEFSRNTGDLGSGNLLGLATNFSYKNRNIWRQTIQSVTNFRYGVEVNVTNVSDNYFTSSLLQTQQVSLGHSYSIPRLIVPFSKWLPLYDLDNKHTLLSFSGGYTARRDLYTLRSLVFNWGYEWAKGNNSWQFKPLNLELYKVDSLSGLDGLFKSNPFLRNSFKNGKVAGIVVSVRKTFGNKNNPDENHFLRFGYEESGILVNQLTNKINEVYEYNKIEAEHRYQRKLRKNELATRLFVGAGLQGSGNSMPVFKQYFMGGPNSMRAWQLRQLGLGNSVASDTVKSGYTDRFGDFCFETNLEYRFALGSISGVKIGSCLFADMGNIWNLKNNGSDANSLLSLSDMTKGMALGVGSGVRVDFSYFLIRVDLGYKLRDPARQSNNGWTPLRNIGWTSTRDNGATIKDYSVQLGIGLPF